MATLPASRLEIDRLGRAMGADRHTVSLDRMALGMRSNATPRLSDHMRDTWSIIGIQIDLRRGRGWSCVPSGVLLKTVASWMEG
jgi:hypothetical protein